MADTPRPLSPHLQIYKWQVQMLTSILHRATGVVLAVGTLIILWGLLALAGGSEAYARFAACIGSSLGLLVMFGWTWAFAYHLCNGIRHLVQDAGAGYAIAQFVRSSWLSIIGSLVITLLVWAFVLTSGGAA
ncbi:MAG: succinate dehydrogenase, cytochrome b556 subunit [Lysobacterales bacterium 14-68-21]|jgi:succinate dehydrogenase / fumarate reductase cytochrome b subunit|nr:MAG: succinate dehydrogenase, cytochrome b556 subunit [Xanthomonadales bacterium 15-68-25]OZB65339.1 MAG: succinate dehydrogenase, cytochrome b556 subunit [Xanthomonadales bacterium 14-68-21]